MRGRTSVALSLWLLASAGCFPEPYAEEGRACSPEHRCSEDFVCVADRCVSRAGSVACSVEAPCTGTDVCIESRCVPRVADGCSSVNPCAGTDVCIGGHCLDRDAVSESWIQVIALGSTWKYSDGTTDPPGDWMSASFVDASWPEGPGQLGYGEGDEATALLESSAPATRPIAAFFRREFVLEPAASGAEGRIKLIRDDGAVVYLNGAELARSNMPAGTIGPRTLSADFLGSEPENQPIELLVPAGLLLEGRNVLAVEVHQCEAGSSDLSFDLALDVKTFVGGGG